MTDGLDFCNDVSTPIKVKILNHEINKQTKNSPYQDSMLSQTSTLGVPPGEAAHQRTERDVQIKIQNFRFIPWKLFLSDLILTTPLYLNLSQLLLKNVHIAIWFWIEYQFEKTQECSKLQNLKDTLKCLTSRPTLSNSISLSIKVSCKYTLFRK